jgi:hypothetical protein
VAQAGSTAIDAQMANEDGWSGSGANPWHLDANTESVLFFTNESDQPAHVGLSITAENVHYFLTSLELAPYETRAIKIRQLRDAQTADFKGHKVPLDATDGSVNWVRMDDVPMTGRLLVIRKGQGTASSYDCCTCACPLSFTDQVSVSPTPSFDFLPGQTAACACTATYYSCNNNPYYYDETVSASWSSSDTSVATMDSSVSGQADAQAAGSATIQATYSADQWYWYQPQGRCLSNPIKASGGTTANVRRPYAAVVTGTVAQGAANCGSGEAGWSRTVYLQLQDQSGSGIAISGITMADSIEIGSPNDLGASNTNTGSHVTDNTGSSADTYSVCSTACPGSGQSDALQDWTYNGLALSYANAIVYECSSITNDGK